MRYKVSKLLQHTLYLLSEEFAETKCAAIHFITFHRLVFVSKTLHIL